MFTHSLEMIIEISDRLSSAKGAHVTFPSKSNQVLQRLKL